MPLFTPIVFWTTAVQRKNVNSAIANCQKPLAKS
jgi:hypothetical protein